MFPTVLVGYVFILDFPRYSVRYVKIGYNLYLLQCESIICKIQVVKRFILHFVKNIIDFHFTLCYNEGTHKKEGVVLYECCLC